MQLIGRPVDKKTNFSYLSYALAFSATVLLTTCPAHAVETSTQATPKINVKATKFDFSLDPKDESTVSERQEIDNFLKEIEEAWNNHRLEKVMNYYSDDYVNNDGLTKKAIRELTKDFWKTYPDAKSSSKTKSIRVEGKFATVKSRDKAVGSTAKIMPSIGSKGLLTSISESQLYLKKVRGEWKIIGDRVDYEKVKVAFGIARDLNTSFVAPELVKSGQEYLASVTVNLPGKYLAIGSISSEPLKFPQPTHKDVWKPVENKMLARFIRANQSNHNELLMATIGITDTTRTSLKGLTYLTRRMNVVPEKEGPANSKNGADEKAQNKSDPTSILKSN